MNNKTHTLPSMLQIFCDDTGSLVDASSNAGVTDLDRTFGLGSFG